MPPISRFGGGKRELKKQGIIDKLKSFFDKYFGLGLKSMDDDDVLGVGEYKKIIYEMPNDYELQKVAKDISKYK